MEQGGLNIAMDSRTKIVATLGPASETAEVLDDLLAAGVDVVRLNLSHGTVEDHVLRLHAVRAAADRVGRVVGILADLPGPKVRAGQLPPEGVQLVAGAQLRLKAGEGPSHVSCFEVDYATPRAVRIRLKIGTDENFHTFETTILFPQYRHPLKLAG